MQKKSHSYNQEKDKKLQLVARDVTHASTWHYCRWCDAKPARKTGEFSNVPPELTYFIWSRIYIHPPGPSWHVLLSDVPHHPPVLLFQATALSVVYARRVAGTLQETLSLDPCVRAMPRLSGLGWWWLVVFSVYLLQGSPREWRIFYTRRHQWRLFLFDADCFWFFCLCLFLFCSFLVFFKSLSIEFSDIIGLF